ncbi:MAG TPA: hypothetical protein PK693_11190 [Halothiobacillus sp.]|jgi:hypothetical protein|nr:MAG: hypothetical protein B7Y53_00700 [Halothiobacillus sp. 28-55-5]OZA79343.1 MAG: hypothetical protein B7X64_10325 [Halothiobacillus sp. 39-53-45]HQS03729.1 hypothetical protein [Halothiobacillus sp.]HQS29996.1 hypothetical protein [Halothiobacillus sp.]
MPNAQAGRIADTTGICVGASTNTACVGAWNLGNVQVDLIRVLDGSVFDATFNETTGVYGSMTVGDSFVSNVYNDTSNTSLMAKLSGKVWPIGEPTGIKAVNNDPSVNNGKPANCLINTAYLAGFYLDSATPKPVVCSSPFQSHKRFKVALQPATVDGVTSGDGKPVDLVFNAAFCGAPSPDEKVSSRPKHRRIPARV